MKKLLYVFIAALLVCGVLSGCDKDSEPTNIISISTTSEASEATDKPAVKENDHSSDESNKSKDNIDLTQLSSTMVYSEVYNMMSSPDSYIGKTVKARGRFAVYHDELSGKNYFAVLIADATACCQQGLEFILGNDSVYPDDYPTEQTEITVQGVFETYMEGEKRYPHLVNAEIVY